MRTSRSIRSSAISLRSWFSSARSSTLRPSISPRSTRSRSTQLPEALLAPSVTRRLIEEFAAQTGPGGPSSAPLQQLTPRERDVLMLIARGMSNLEIAQRLFVGESTVKTHVAHVLSKLGARDRIHAVVFAYESGLVQPGQP